MPIVHIHETELQANLGRLGSTARGLATGRGSREAGATPDLLNPSTLMRLQRLAGNAAVVALVSRDNETERGAAKSGGPALHKLEGQEDAAVQRVPDAGAAVAIPAGTKWKPGSHVAPNFVVSHPAPTRSNTDPSTTNTDDPTFTGAPAVDDAARVWRYQINSVESKGTIQLVYFDEGHYPAPTPTDDTGGLTNVKKANWKAIVKDLHDNRSGVPNFWSAYKRESLHENYHWEVEWQGQVKPAVMKAEGEIAKISEAFDSAPTGADADAKLKPKAGTIFKDEMDKARDAYNKLGDSPGDPPYVAQAPGLDAMKKRVEDHAKAKKWK
jgi:hypothetical protein